MDREYFRRLTSTGILIVLLVLSFFLIRPIFLALLLALILAFLLHPFYRKIKRKIKSENFSALIVALILAILIILPIWFLTPILLTQSFEFYQGAQQIDFVTPLKKVFPDVFASESFSREVGSAISSFVSRSTNAMVNLIAELIRDFPILFLQALVMFFTFFVALKDQKKFLDYIRSVLPFSKEVEDKLFESSKGITYSVIYGQAVLGVLQGIVVGIGLFIFNVPNALFLTLLASLAGIFPVIGTTIIWVPTVIYLFATGSIVPAIGIALFGMLASTIDGFVKPVFISKRVDMHPALVLVSMVGGLLLFGLIGVIIGPLIFAYLFIILEIYRDKRVPGVFKELKRKK